MIDLIPDAASLEDVLERLELYSSIEIGSAQCDRGETIPHEEVVAMLDTECRETEADHAIVNEMKNHIIKSGHDWNLKEKIQFLAARIDDATTLDRLTRQLDLLRPRVRTTKAELAKYLGIDPSEILDELPDGKEKVHSSLDASLPKRSQRDSRLHRKKRASNGNAIHRANEESNKRSP